MAAFDVSAGSDLNIDFIALGFNVSDVVYSNSVGTPQNGPGTESAPWSMRVMIAHIAAIDHGYEIFETASGQWFRTAQRTFSSGSMSCGPWVKVAAFSGYVSSVNDKHGDVTITVDGD